MINFTSRLPNEALSDTFELEPDGYSTTVSQKSINPSISTVEYDPSFFEPKDGDLPRKKRRPWKPFTQKSYFLIAVALMSASIVILLQYFLLCSNRDGGIIFARNVNDLPAVQTFCYRYLPTIISLSVSFAWTWIDVDIKRLQPFWQLSRTGGAQGKDSVLLHYPVDFVAFVPFKALRRRHWPVFSASFAVVVITWGLTPLQSGIFATKTMTRSSVLAAASSSTYMSLDEQRTKLTGSYVQSVYNIAWLNETLPPFMSRDGMLVPFGLVHPLPTVETAESWTAPTRLYSVDITCHDAVKTNTTWKSWNGCEFDELIPPSDIREDQYASSYVGYWPEDSMDMYLSGSCPDSANRTFALQWGRGQEEAVGDLISSTNFIEATTLYCESSYYQQDVNATVVLPQMTVTRILPLGPKQPLPEDLFNVTDFEQSMSAGSEKILNRGDNPPAPDWPDATQHLQYLDLARLWDWLPPLTGFAIAAYQRPAPDYMNATLLKDSYQAAYRLLFARRLSDILSSELDRSDGSSVLRTYQTQAVVLVPTFVYIVEVIVGATTAIACILLGLSFVTANNLKSDPSNIASLMALAAGDEVLCEKFGCYDRAGSEDVKEAFEDSTFGLLEETKLRSGEGYGLKIFGHPSGDRSVPRKILSADRVLPIALSWFSGAAFLTIQLCVLIVLTYVFIWSQKNNGMTLPSTSIFVNQLVKNYIPMAIAGCFEPIWVVLNRVLCMLQPYEQLRKGNALAGKTLTVDYSSLPPQAVILRALRAGHISLAIICTMAILANVLSLTFNSILFEDTVSRNASVTFTQPLQLPLNGTSIGRESFDLGKNYYDPYFIAMSNFTAGTSLPSWTDAAFFYLPFQNQSLSNTTDTVHQATTHAVSGSLSCVHLMQSGPNNYSTRFSGRQIQVKAAMTFPNMADRCSVELSKETSGSASGDVAMEVVIWDKTNTSSNACSNVVIAGWLRSHDASSKNQTWIACKPGVQISHRRATVDLEGVILSSTPVPDLVKTTESAFEPSASSFVASVHDVFDQIEMSVYRSSLGAFWHNDSYPSDFFSYFITKDQNSSAFLDPALPSPSYAQATSAFTAVYARLFAIILGTNAQKILQPTTDITVSGSSIKPEVRIFVSRPMFMVSIVILGLYILSTVVIYATRPWKILPRMPTSIASQIAFFGGSHLLEDLKSTAPMTAKGRNWYIKSLGSRYGFGRFLGVDGKAHIGIEREPLVQVLKKDDLRTDQEWD